MGNKRADQLTGNIYDNPKGALEIFNQGKLLHQVLVAMMKAAEKVLE